MEPELGAWSTLEYIAIAKETTAPSKFYLSSLPASLASSLPNTITSLKSDNFVTTTESIETLPGVDKSRVCLLDPQAQEELRIEDAEKFDWFVFGGILGTFYGTGCVAPKVDELWLT